MCRVGIRHGALLELHRIYRHLFQAILHRDSRLRSLQLFQQSYRHVHLALTHLDNLLYFRALLREHRRGHHLVYQLLFHPPIPRVNQVLHLRTIHRLCLVRNLLVVPVISLLISHQYHQVRFRQMNPARDPPARHPVFRPQDHQDHHLRIQPQLLRVYHLPSQPSILHRVLVMYQQYPQVPVQLPHLLVYRALFQLIRPVAVHLPGRHFFPAPRLLVVPALCQVLGLVLLHRPGLLCSQLRRRQDILLQSRR